MLTAISADKADHRFVANLLAGPAGAHLTGRVVFHAKMPKAAMAFGAAEHLFV